MNLLTPPRRDGETARGPDRSRPPTEALGDPSDATRFRGPRPVRAGAGFGAAGSPPGGWGSRASPSRPGETRTSRTLSPDSCFVKTDGAHVAWLLRLWGVVLVGVLWLGFSGWGSRRELPSPQKGLRAEDRGRFHRDVCCSGLQQRGRTELRSPNGKGGKR